MQDKAELKSLAQGANQGRLKVLRLEPMSILTLI